MQAKDSSPPDGGYGWVVVVSAFMVMGLTAAVLKTFGLFFVEIQQHFDELASTTSWITSVTIAIFHLGAPVASSLCVRYSHRAVVITGGFLAFSGMALGFFGLNMVWMYATTGFLQGLIVDMAGDYRAGFYMAGATLVLSAGFLVILDQFQQRKERGSQTNTKLEKSMLPYPSLHPLKLQNSEKEKIKEGRKCCIKGKKHST